MPTLHIQVGMVFVMNVPLAYSGVCACPRIKHAGTVTRTQGIFCNNHLI